MGCCGQNRAALRRRLTVSPSNPPAVEVVEPPASAGPPVRLHYVQSRAILVRGPVTGRIYQFSAAHADGNVDSRDAAPLLRTSLFRQAGGTTTTDNPRMIAVFQKRGFDMRIEDTTVYVVKEL